jgi:nitrate reductase NapE component
VKRRCVAFLLLLFGLWPLCQHALVRVYGVDPWKLFGWAMYCVPGAMKTLRVVLIDAEGGTQGLDFRAYTPEEQRLVDRFRSHRQALGRLASPEPLARGMLELHPEAAGVFLPVLSLELEPESARLTQRYATSTHWRDGREQPLDISREALGRLFAP